MKFLGKCLFFAIFSIVILNLKDFKVEANYTPVGKGLIYYTENYINNINKSLPPVPDSQIDTFSQNYISGADCSRYKDLTDRELNYFQDLGLDFVIVGFGPASWYNLAPTKPTNPAFWNDSAYQFSKLDEWIGKLQNKNITVVLQLWGTPTWSSGVVHPQQNGCENNSYPDFHPYNKPPTNHLDFADFVQAVGSRYDGTRITNPVNSNQKLKVDIFSLWNEPNNAQGKDFWDGSVSDFVTLSNAAYDRIKSTRPDAIIWGPNLLGNWSDPEGFLSQTANQLKTDVFSIHTYPADFNADATDVNNKVKFAIGNLPHLLETLDQIPAYQGKPVAITEIGYRSNWENQFVPGSIQINEKKKGQFLKSSLENISRANADGRIIAVANNTLYNSWRWWSTGLISYTDPDTSSVTYSDLLPAYQIFKNWSLSNSSVPINNSNPPTNQTDAIYFDINGGLTSINRDRYWYLSSGDTWSTNTLQSAYSLSPNWETSGVPLSWIDTAYFDQAGNYTVTKGDRYWYRQASPNNNSSWFTNSLQSAYFTPLNASSINIPVKDIDASYWDSTGGLTVIKRGRYWFRSSSTANWQSDSLQNYYSTSPNWISSGIPTENIDTSFYDLNNNLVVVKGSRFWKRATNTSNWQSGLLDNFLNQSTNYDLNNDGRSDILDLARIVNKRLAVSVSVPSDTPEDLDSDFDVDGDDLNSFLSQYTHL